MTVKVENNADQGLEQSKVDTNVNQQKVDTNLTQQPEKKDDGTQEDPNWKAFREARKKDRAEREAAETRAREKEAEVAAYKAAMEAAFPKQSPVAQNNQLHGNEVYEETEDERIEKKVQAAIASREARAEQEHIAREQREYPQRLAQTYPDFNQTIAQENLDYLDFHYPEVSRPLQRLPQGYDKWSDIYQAVKKFVPNTNAKKDAAKADNNFTKPKSMSSTGITQPGEIKSASVISEERKAANWARMQQVLKGVS
jgi:hypothetical protein